MCYRHNLVSFAGKDRLKGGEELRGVHSAGVQVDACAATEKEIPKKRVGFIAHLPDGRHDPFLGLPGNPMPVGLAVDDEGNDSAGDPRSPGNIVAIYPLFHKSNIC